MTGDGPDPQADELGSAPGGVPAVTVRQPYAALIMGQLPGLPVKDVENRTWAARHRGRLWIHAAAPHRGRPPAALPPGVLPPGAAIPTDLPCRAVVGTVELVDIIDGADSPWAVAGCRHWLLADPRPLPEPVPMPGRQSVWRSAELAALALP